MYYWMGLAAAIALIAYWVQRHPAFGGSSTAEERKRYLQLPYYNNGKFRNPVHTAMDMSAKALYSMIRDSLFSRTERRPKQPLPAVSFEPERMGEEGAAVVWFGHSTYMISLEGKRLLVDPMFSDAPSPVPLVGTRRFSNQLPLDIGRMPAVDAVLITHDHYDHLDYRSIMRLKQKAGHYFVPAGVANHLIRWGVEKERITELVWWEEVRWNGLTLASTPARHFSGRGLLNRDSTLWTSWVLIGETAKIFVGGDGGYGPHFKEIGERYGPFDLTMMECGQYDERWSEIHMKPEQTVQAHLDVGGDLLFPVHWGAFTLAFHDWREPVERALAEAGKKGVRVTTPRIGEVVALHGRMAPAERWWRNPAQAPASAEGVRINRFS